MGQTPSAPSVSWEPPHPATGEGVQERLRPVVDFLLQRLVTYLNEASNFFAINLKRVETEFCWYRLLLRDMNVLRNRFGGEAIVQEIFTFKLETLRMLAEMTLWKLQLSLRQRGIVSRVFGSAAVTGLIAATSVALTPAVLAVVGFTRMGVAAGSAAAAMQPTTIVAGSLFSICQSIGALGTVSTGATAAVTTTAVVVGATGGGLIANGGSNDSVNRIGDRLTDNSTLPTHASDGMESATSESEYKSEKDSEKPAKADNSQELVPVASEVQDQEGLRKGEPLQEADYVDLFSWEFNMTFEELQKILQ